MSVPGRARHKDIHYDEATGFEADASISTSVLAYVHDFSRDTAQHARLTLAATSTRERAELQAAYLQDRIETTAAYVQEIVELARLTPLGLRVPFFGATRERSQKT